MKKGTMVSKRKVCLRGREGTWEKLEAELYHWTSKKARDQAKVGEEE